MEPDPRSPAHLAHLERKFGKSTPPWPFVNSRTAAQLLGVTTEQLERLANKPIPAVRVTTKAGNKRWVFQKEAIDQAVARKAGLQG